MNKSSSSKQQLPNKQKSDFSFLDLSAFVAIVEEENFFKAAERLGISQPAISIRLQNIESQLGFRLIDRRQGSVPTGLGLQVYKSARRIVVELSTLKKYVSGVELLHQSYLRIGFSTPTVAMELLGNLLKNIPGIRLKLIEANTLDLLEKLKRDEIDVSIMTLNKPLVEPFKCVLIKKQKLTALIPSKHMLASKKNISWQTIINEPLIIRAKPSMTYLQIEEELETKGFTLKSHLETPSREAMKEAVASGLGIGLTFITETGDDNRFVTAPISDAINNSAIYFVTYEDMMGLPEVEKFFEIVRNSPAN